MERKKIINKSLLALAAAMMALSVPSSLKAQEPDPVLLDDLQESRNDPEENQENLETDPEKSDPEEEQPEEEEGKDPEEEEEEEEEDPEEEQPNEEEEEISFDDINPENGNWFNSYVLEAAKRKLMTGLNEKEFGPHETMTRGMIATVLYRMAGEPETEFEKIFEDVNEGLFYSIPVTWASSQGVMTGYDSNDKKEFGVMDPITREQFATVLVRFASKNGLDVSNSQVLDHYLDQSEISSFAMEGVKWCVKAYLMQGAQELSYLYPKQSATRAEAAKLLVVFDDLVKNGSAQILPGLYMLENGNPVYLDSDLQAVSGFQTVGKKTFYFDPKNNGYMICNSLHKLSPDENQGQEKSILARKDGSLVKGSYILNGWTYECSSDFSAKAKMQINQSRISTHNTFTSDPKIEKETEAELRTGKDFKLKYIVIHYTAGVTSSHGQAPTVLDWFDSIDSASATFVVDDDSVWQYSDYEKGFRDWHCGDDSRSGYGGGSLFKIATNYNSIGIEICSNSRTGSPENANSSAWYFTDASVANAAELTRGLLGVYPELEVIRHYDVSGKVCPGVPGWNDYKNADDSAWKAFLKSVGK